MRLPEFILVNSESILREWENFARSIWPTTDVEPRELRDHAAAILSSVGSDMLSEQSAQEQLMKSKGQKDSVPETSTLNDASTSHALARLRSGLQLPTMVSEYRALRAAVLRLWTENGRPGNPHDDADVTRFHEAIDQALSESVRAYTEAIDRSRELFLGILGHDLRNPLNAIMLLAEQASDPSISGPKAAELAERITVSGQAMVKMLADFSDFTQTRLGRPLLIRPVPMHLGSLCGEVVRELEPVEQSRVAVAADGRLQGEWDPARLRQLISNLVGNALSHGAPEATVNVSLLGGPDGVSLVVKNEGAPIAADLLPLIFDPLVQSPKKRRKEAALGSMGLGLYIAKAVAVAHGGTIEVRSTAAHGTTFTVRLPYRPSQTSSSSEA